ncbi:MAG: hypothetical protein ACK5V5_10755 [Cyclobacteriaceae bacterium]|jgi:hypothetical protein|nr:hypothetical protein [Flammeovirgaceae bacterium]
MKWFWIALAALTSSCQQPVADKRGQRPLYNFDSLLAAQGTQPRYITKITRVNQVVDSVVLTLTAGDWQKELAVFKKLQAVNRSAYRDQYVMREYDDPRSNLTVREYHGRHAPVGILRLYFLDRPQRIQKIEAIHREKSFFFSAERQFRLQFESPGAARLSGFGQQGGQKVFWGDTTLFDIQVRMQ